MRCEICDYLEGHGNQYLFKPTSFNVVRKRPNGKYECNECHRAIKTAYSSDSDQDEWFLMHLDNQIRHNGSVS